MNTELAPNVQSHILKLINAYCSATFTIMSTSLDSTLSVPWSSSSTSIVAIGNDNENPNNSSCLFDLVNGIYLIDSHHIEVNTLLFIVFELYFGLIYSKLLGFLDFKMGILKII